MMEKRGENALRTRRKIRVRFALFRQLCGIEFAFFFFQKIKRKFSSCLTTAITNIVTNLNWKSLFQVRDLVERCTCPTQFPMIRVSEGKYRIGDTKVLIFVRILRSHVMVRVGGGWDTLSHYLDKHDPCRCRTCK